MTVTGITTLTGALNANGGINCDTNKFTVADSTGNTVIGGTLNVTGATTLTGALNANGGIAISSSTAISGGSTTSGSSNLSVYGLRVGSGKVGIGTTTPTEALDVNGKVNATSFNALSDYRIKSNIVPLSDTEFKVDLLRPVFYFNKLIKKNDIGFIAHEVSEHFPFLVSRNKDDAEYQSLNYIGIIGLLTNEIIEIKKRNKIIDEELIEIKNKINELI